MKKNCLGNYSEVSLTKMPETLNLGFKPRRSRENFGVLLRGWCVLLFTGFVGCDEQKNNIKTGENREGEEEKI